MPYAISFKPAARRQLAKLPAEASGRIARKIDALADDPRPPGCRKLAGADDLWRIRVGEYRVIYQIQDDRRVVIVATIGHRRDVYR